MDIFDNPGTSPESPGSPGTAEDDEDGASVMPTQEDADASQLSAQERRKKKRDRKKYGIRLLDADKCVNYDVEEPDAADAGGGRRGGPSRGKRARRR
ncbi:hypothetical protein FOZ62_020056 [Perkinsus olseni]|uniref:Uncharacterized protein n=1 Tax=Perkinsus olseni TaxID=32597 RepID=A0A7J6Q2N5_PEROL|nr:hypothetical protein FOZ62_020056 [Perkinsus olseni]